MSRCSRTVNSTGHFRLGQLIHIFLWMYAASTSQISSDFSALRLLKKQASHTAHIIICWYYFCSRDPQENCPRYLSTVSKTLESTVVQTRVVRTPCLLYPTNFIVQCPRLTSAGPKPTTTVEVISGEIVAAIAGGSKRILGASQVRVGTSVDSVLLSPLHSVSVRSSADPSTNCFI